MEPIGPAGEAIMDYSIYDALKAGFGKVVFVINKTIEKTFREMIGQKIEKVAEVDYVFQNINDLPRGTTVPPGREKPWGTGHAVLSCRDSVHSPFIVINADDFYGASSYKLLYDFLKEPKTESAASHFAMAGFMLGNTLSEHGQVSRGVCALNTDGYLSDIRERTKIEKTDGAIVYSEAGTTGANLPAVNLPAVNLPTTVSLPADTIVSMNIWAFTPDIFNELERCFTAFVHDRDSRNELAKAEFFLPKVVGGMIHEDKADVKVLLSDERWYGVTYREDVETVRKAIKKMIADGVYPPDLWGSALY